MDQRDLSRTYFREVKELYDFVSEQITAGLFKSEILDRLIELGVDRFLAFDVLQEMERRLSTMRKRVVVFVGSETEERERVRKEFWISGYDVAIHDNLKTLERRLIEKVPDLIIVDALDYQLKGRDVLYFLRSHIIGRKIPVFVLSDPSMPEKDFQKWEGLQIFQRPYSADDMLEMARELFLKPFFGEED